MLTQQSTDFRDSQMRLWQRLLITVASMLLLSFTAGLLWRWFFDVDMPSYLSGLVGGMTALPVWELLKWGLTNPATG
jgi:hypothetical protein